MAPGTSAAARNKRSRPNDPPTRARDCGDDRLRRGFDAERREALGHAFATSGIVDPIVAVDRAENDQADGHALAVDFEAQRVGETFERLSRGDVRGGVRPGHVGSRRGHVDDLSAPAREHVWQKGAGGGEGGEIGQLDHRSRFSRLCLDCRQPAACAGIVDENVGNADGAPHRLAESRDRVQVGEVAGEDVRLPAAGGDLGGDRRQPFGGAGDEDNPRALGGESSRRRLANPARSPRSPTPNGLRSPFHRSHSARRSGACTFGRHSQTVPSLC